MKPADDGSTCLIIFQIIPGAHIFRAICCLFHLKLMILTVIDSVINLQGTEMRWRNRRQFYINDIET